MGSGGPGSSVAWLFQLGISRSWMSYGSCVAGSWSSCSETAVTDPWLRRKVGAGLAVVLGGDWFAAERGFP